MRMRTELSHSDIANGFDAINDIFSRKDLALRLTGLFEQLEHGSVSLLDGRWGTGKTTFVKQWAAELEGRGIPSIYFDAFSYDYIESPFQAVAGSFVKAAIQARRTDAPAYRNYLAKAAAVGKTIAAVSAKVGIKAATLGAVSVSDLGELGEVGKVLTDGLADATEEGVRKLLEEHAEAENKFDELRRALEDLPELLSSAESSETSPPLIVFIDELDRCRPDFSLGILEVLKHFFRANKLHFVLVTNKAALEASVNHRYGVGDLAPEYIEKFYDFTIFFESTAKRYEAGSAIRFLDQTLSGIIPENTRDGIDVRDYMIMFVEAYQLTLRQIQAYATNVGISFLAAKENELRPAILIAFLALLKIRNPTLYRRAKSGVLTWQEVDAFLATGSWKESEDERIGKVVRFHLDRDLDITQPEWQGWDTSLWRYNIERHRVIMYLANSVLDRFGAPSVTRKAE